MVRKDKHLIYLKMRCRRTVGGNHKVAPLMLVDFCFTSKKTDFGRAPKRSRCYYLPRLVSTKYTQRTSWFVSSPMGNWDEFWLH